MLAKIQYNQIHHYVRQVMDAEGDVSDKDVLQIDVTFPEFPHLPAYRLAVDFPFTIESVKAAVKTLAIQAKEQIAKDAIVREQLKGALEFDVEV